MLPQLDHEILASQLTTAQYLTLQMLVMLVQTYKNIQIEKLAENLALPIKYVKSPTTYTEVVKLKNINSQGNLAPDYSRNY